MKITYIAVGAIVFSCAVFIAGCSDETKELSDEQQNQYLSQGAK